MTGMSAQPRAHRARAAHHRAKERQTGGGCVGGLGTCPCKVPLLTGAGAASIECGDQIAAAKMAPTNLKHLYAHASELLQSSDGQQGMLPWPGIDISTGVVDTAATPVAGRVVTDMAIRTARIVRAATIGKLSAACGDGSILPA